MSGTFSGIGIAFTALQAQQAALNTLNNNVANANTPGYKRQRVTLAEGNPLAMTYGNDATRLTAEGTGVRIEQIQRVQNDFVDNRVRQTSALSSEWSARSDTLGQIEAILNEPSDGGIASKLDAFFGAWDQLSAQPDDTSARNSLVEKAQTLTMQIRQSYAQLQNIADDTDKAVTDKVTQINSLTSQIAELNQKIAWSSTSSVSPNDLLDQRDLLVGQLSSLAGVEVSGQGGQDFMATLGNKILVQGVVADQLGVRPDVNGFQEVYSVSTGESRPIPGGEIAGLLDSRVDTIPGLMGQLDFFVATLSSEVNKIHTTGVTKAGVAAGDFFDATTTASDFEVSAGILASTGNIATGLTAAPHDNSVSNDIAALKDQILGSGQTINQIYQSVVSGVGTQSALAKQYAQTQSATLDQFTAQQESVSGVSLDEEMTDMIKFQQCYNSAARVLTACDDMLSTLIDKTGLVGR